MQPRSQEWEKSVAALTRDLPVPPTASVAEIERLTNELANANNTIEAARRRGLTPLTHPLPDTESRRAPERRPQRPGLTTCLQPRTCPGRDVAMLASQMTTALPIDSRVDRDRRPAAHVSPMRPDLRIPGAGSGRHRHRPDRRVHHVLSPAGARRDRHARIRRSRLRREPAHTRRRPTTRPSRAALRAIARPATPLGRGTSRWPPRNAADQTVAGIRGRRVTVRRQ